MLRRWSWMFLFSLRSVTCYGHSSQPTLPSCFIYISLVYTSPPLVPGCCVVTSLPKKKYLISTQENVSTNLQSSGRTPLKMIAAGDDRTCEAGGMNDQASLAALGLLEVNFFMATGLLLCESASCAVCCSLWLLVELWWVSCFVSLGLFKPSRPPKSKSEALFFCLCFRLGFTRLRLGFLTSKHYN